VAGGLSHPNIVTIYDVVEKEGHLFIAMEYIEGKELSQFCTEDALLGHRKIASIIAQVCEALDYAHRQGIVHRDIKPSNIMLLKEGRPKIMDFGITKMLTSDATQTAGMLGTPSYMSPEQIDGDEVDGRSDLFCVGIVFYELIAGQRPFTGPSVASILNQILKADPDPLQTISPEVHPKLVALVNKLLAKDRSERYQSGAEVLVDLDLLLDEPSVWE
jgi:serine/threonine-protein kinase